MTKQEFVNWTAFTQQSQHQWKIDPIHCKEEDFLAYIGGKNGVYCMINKEDSKFKMRIGDYQNAIPHIGEATFIVKGMSTFNSFDEAFNRLAGAVGHKLLLDISGVHCI